MRPSAPYHTNPRFLGQAMFAAEIYPAVDTLIMVANVAPIALYFLILGLVNSHARPYLISSRSDFIALTIALAPVLMWPVPSFVQAGMVWPLIVGLLLAAVAFFLLLPRHDAGFVIYNISEARCMRIVGEAMRRLGLRGRWDGGTWRSEGDDFRVHLGKVAMLRNVTLHVEGDPSPTADAVAGGNGPKSTLVDQLGLELATGLKCVSQLPSAMGACLVVIGVAIMIVPMWMVSRHIDDLVDAMSHLFG